MAAKQLEKVVEEHFITLNDEWYYAVQSGRKKWEGRRVTNKTKAFKTGDILVIGLSHKA